MRQQGAGLIVIDMGSHILPKVPGAQLLIQIAVPGLEERARCLPPLRSKELTPGKPLTDDFVALSVMHEARLLSACCSRKECLAWRSVRPA